MPWFDSHCAVLYSTSSEKEYVHIEKYMVQWFDDHQVASTKLYVTCKERCKEYQKSGQCLLC